MSFDAPVLLVFLLLVPAAVAGYVWLERRRTEQVARWTMPALLPNLVTASPGRRRHIPAALLLAGLALLLVGFARPKATHTVKRQEATVVFVLDVSGSMAARDVPPTRIAAARSAAERLVAKVPKRYRIALITFSDHAAVVTPPTTDRKTLVSALERARTGPEGTALTTAIERAVDVAKSVPGTGKRASPPAVAIVFSDGAQTSRGPTPAQVSSEAKKAHVPVSAVALGTPNGVVDQKIAGGYTEQIDVPVETTLLSSIARASGGRFTTSLDDRFLESTVSALGSRVGHERKTFEITAAAAGGGMALMIAGALLSGVWFRRLL